MLANCNRSFHFGVSWAYYMTLVLFIKVSDCACFVNKGFLLLIGTIWKWEGKCSGCTQRWGKALRFSRLAKLVQFGAATADLGTGWPFISAGGWREREILFQEKDNLRVASRTRKESFKSRKLQIQAASELGLFMQMKYLCPQVCVLFCLVFFFFFQSCTTCSAFPHFLAPVSIAACNHTLTQMPFRVQSTECYRAY